MHYNNQSNGPIAPEWPNEFFDEFWKFYKNRDF